MHKDLIVFGEDWGRHPSSTQHLIKHLAVAHKVMWVNSIGMRRPRFTLSDAQRAMSKTLAMLQPRTSNQVARNEIVDIIHPRALPWPGSRMARRVNQTLLSNQLSHEMKKRDIAKPILWLSLPNAVDLVGKLKERATVYYCGDDFAALDGVDHQPIAHMEQALADKADLILVASAALQAKFPSNKTVVLPHGVDSGLFSTPQERPLDLPTGKPIAGFYGSLSAWLNVELLSAVAQRLAHWNFVFIGNVQTDVTALRRLPNVFFLGAKPHAQLPAYVQHWQVSLLPFHDNAQIRACNPLKLREYLSAGRPIVSTDFPALDGYRDLLHVAVESHCFAQAIEMAAADLPRGDGAFLSQLNEWQDVIACGDNYQRRQQRVADESWQARAAQVEALLAQL